MSMHSKPGRNVLIICNGEPPTEQLAKRLAKTADLVVAADGGANIARKLGVRADVIIGDLDSISRSTRKHFSKSTLIHVRRQDNTDLEKALDYVREQKFQEISIIAATGGRLDFTLGNLAVIWKYVADFKITVEGDGWTAMPIGAGGEYTATVGTTMSLLPLGRCSGITLRRVEYPLTNSTMEVGEIGVSNVVCKSPFTVRVKKGCMLMILQQGVRTSGRKK